jgi:ribonuclease BN (tRNA processing enzyme)
MFDVTFLGTGSAMPDGERAQTGLLLERVRGAEGGGETEGERDDIEAVLVDCGSGVLCNLARTDPGYEGISTLLLTHHHVDHVADLMPLCKARWLAGATELEIVGPAGTEALVEGLFAVHEYMKGRIDLTIREVGPGAFSLPGFDARAMATRHSMDCLAYRFEVPDADDGAEEGIRNETDDEEGTENGTDDGTLAFVFSGDSEAFPELVEFADGATLAHDCSFPDEVDVSNHPTPAQLGEALAAADADLDRVYLTHLYPHTRGHGEEMLNSIAESYAGDVRFARDGLTVEVE